MSAMRLVHTKSEVPIYGPTTRDPSISKIITKAPEANATSSGRISIFCILLFLKKFCSQDHFSRFNKFCIIGETYVGKHISALDIRSSFYFEIFRCDHRISVLEYISVTIFNHENFIILLIEPRTACIFCHNCVLNSSPLPLQRERIEDRVLCL